MSFRLKPPTTSVSNTAPHVQTYLSIYITDTWIYWIKFSEEEEEDEWGDPYSHLWPVRSSLIIISALPQSVRSLSIIPGVFAWNFRWFDESTTEGGAIRSIWGVKTLINDLLITLFHLLPVPAYRLQWLSNYGVLPTTISSRGRDRPADRETLPGPLRRNTCFVSFCRANSQTKWSTHYNRWWWWLWWWSLRSGYVVN